MKKFYRNPPGSPTPKSYHHVVSTEGGRMIFLSGQVAFDCDRQIVGKDDVVAQTRQAMRNLKAAVETGDGEISDIVQITTHVVNYDPSQLDEITGLIAEFPHDLTRWWRMEPSTNAVWPFRTGGTRPCPHPARLVPGNWWRT